MAGGISLVVTHVQPNLGLLLLINLGTQLPTSQISQGYRRHTSDLLAHHYAVVRSVAIVHTNAERHTCRHRLQGQLGP